MSCCLESLPTLDLNAFTNSVFRQKIGFKQNGVLVDLTGYTVKAEIDVRLLAKVPFVVTWLPPNPDLHFLLSLSVATLSAIAPGVYQWDWLLIDLTNTPTRMPGGSFTVHRGITTP